MNNTSHHSRGFRALKQIAACAALAFTALQTASAAVTWKNIQFGGFASQGFLINSGDNDYFGDTSDGTFDFREYALNASWSAGKFRVGAQGFGQKLGDYGDDKITLDWAIVDYQATQWFGVRAGRVKMPRGLYNEALDVDSVRPFVLLPQSVYDARLRDFNAALNGGMVYGNVSLKKLGSLDYRFFYGDIPMSTDSGANDYFNNDVPYANVSIGMDSVFGGSVFWNTPVNGLRAGFSYTSFEEFTANRLVPIDIPGYGRIELTMFKSADFYERHLFSVEYSRGDWLFAAEGGFDEARYGIAVVGSKAEAFIEFESTYAYVSAARRINDRLELGAYYSYSKETSEIVPQTVSAITIPELTQHDLALSAKYTVNDNWVLKLEGHYLDGAGKIFDTPTRPQPFAKRDDSWFMVATKATFSF
jgi:hypothetical protein